MYLTRPFQALFFDNRGSLPTCAHSFSYTASKPEYTADEPPKNVPPSCIPAYGGQKNKKETEKMKKLLFPLMLVLVLVLVLTAACATPPMAKPADTDPLVIKVATPGATQEPCGSRAEPQGCIIVQTLGTRFRLINQPLDPMTLGTDVVVYYESFNGLGQRYWTYLITVNIIPYQKDGDLYVQNLNEEIILFFNPNTGGLTYKKK